MLTARAANVTMLSPMHRLSSRRYSLGYGRFVVSLLLFVCCLLLLLLSSSSSSSSSSRVVSASSCAAQLREHVDFAQLERDVPRVDASEAAARVHVGAAELQKKLIVEHKLRITSMRDLATVCRARTRARLSYRRSRSI